VKDQDEKMLDQRHMTMTSAQRLKRVLDIDLK
jgi:hypothetical protein